MTVDNSKKHGIIFDMDGTLWDSAQNVAKSWDLVVQQEYPGHPHITEEAIQRVMGLTMNQIADSLFADLEPEERVRLLDQCCEAENEYLSIHGGVLYPEVEETLQRLQEDYSLYIVSNCQSGYIEAFLEYYHFEQYFADIECYGNHHKLKDYNIADVIRRNELADAVYVGDIQGDYDAAVKAGAKFIHAAYGFGTIRQEVIKINHFSELPKAVQQIF